MSAGRNPNDMLTKVIKSELVKLWKKQDCAKELSQSVKPRTWYLLAVALERPYPYSLEDKYQFIMQLSSKERW